MKTAQVLLSDTHFGTKNNSRSWLTSQKEFIIAQFVPFLRSACEKYDKVTVVHCGDLFDSRSSISPYICHYTNSIIQLISRVSDNIDVVILGGNHDYFSPDESPYNITSLEMLHVDENVKIVSNGTYTYPDTNCMFIPWFQFNNYDTLKKIIEVNKPSCIFTHTDLQHLEQNFKELTNDITIISGHIHIPWFNNNYYNIGSCYSLDFNDANQKRGFYIVEDWKIDELRFIENEKSIRFYKIFNEDILNVEKYLNEKIRYYDKVELNVKQELHSNPKYVDAIKRYNDFCDCRKVVTVDEKTNNTFSQIGYCDLKTMIKMNVPNHLQEKFEIVVKNVEENYN